MWNTSEDTIKNWASHPKEIDKKIHKYCENSKPKIGWEGLEDLNHFELIGKIYSLNKRYKAICLELITQENLQKIIKLLDTDFQLYSELRIDLIKRCLIYRFEKLMKICNL